MKEKVADKIKGLVKLDFNNQRIMTTKVLAEQFGTEDKIIQQNFKRNEKRFLEGKHYFRLTGDELRNFKANLHLEGNLKYASELMLWTDRGAARHAKILDTDEAWDVYEALEENYFNPRENLNKPTCIEDVLISSLQEMKALKGEVQAIKQETVKNKEEIQGIRDVVAINSADWKTDCKNLITKIAYKLGGIGHIQDVYKEVYSTLDKRLGISLSTRLTNKRRRMADEGVCKSRRDKLNYVDVIADDKKLIEGYVALVKELSIKYGVA